MLGLPLTVSDEYWLVFWFSIAVLQITTRLAAFNTIAIYYLVGSTGQESDWVCWAVSVQSVNRLKSRY